MREVRQRQRGFSLVELVVVMGIIAILSGLLLGVVIQVRSAALRVACANNLRQIGLALHHYHGVYSGFPPGVSNLGNKEPYPFMSWHTRLLPYLEQEALWLEAVHAFEEDKDFLYIPPHVAQEVILPIYRCPADPREFYLAWTDRRIAFTSYLGVEGTNQTTRDGMMFLNSQVRFGDVIDGTTNTLFVGERPPSADGRLGWWYAGWGQDQEGSGDMVLGVRELNATIYGPGCPAGPYAFAPGKLADQCDAFHFWSCHPNGAYFMFVDGSVRVLSYSVNPLMVALATRNGREAIALLEN